MVWCNSSRVGRAAFITSSPRLYARAGWASPIPATCDPYRDFTQRQHMQQSRSRYFSSKKQSTSRNIFSLFGLAHDKSIDTRTKSSRQNEGFLAAEKTVGILAQRNRTWKRLAPIVELATSSSHVSSGDASTNRRCIADIGCDHGLLSIALAASGTFELVIGADVSQNALENGAKAFHEKVLGILQQAKATKTDDSDSTSVTTTAHLLPVEFRFGDGLEPLNQGEADAICLAGMGVGTMLSILNCGGGSNTSTSTSTSTSTRSTQLDRLNCQSLYLQPPTSRPRKLMELYEQIQSMDGWVLSDERILKLRKRWYITSAFDRIGKEFDSVGEVVVVGERKQYLLPGHYLSRSHDETQRREYDAYVQHHLSWLNRDLEHEGYLCDHDMIWREANICQSND